MNNYRLASKHESFLRDLMRDYCAVYLTITEQVRRYRRDGNVSFPVLHTLLGEPLSKGVFWRLKDVSHFLFREARENDEQCPGYAPTGQLVDWCIGYAFHECCKLREDAFQGQHYAMRLVQYLRTEDVAGNLSLPLKNLAEETSESSLRELNRIVRVLREGMHLMVQLLPEASDNCPLARWLVTEKESVQQAFHALYPALLKALYGSSPERMYTLAAIDFMDCGRKDEAKFWLRTAWEEGSLDEDGERMLQALECQGDWQPPQPA